MVSIIISIVSVALVVLLVLATLYYGANALTNSYNRASAAKVINQSTQVLGAAELFYTDHSRWPKGVAELIEKEYLRENPIYLSTDATSASRLYEKLGIPAAYAYADEPARGNEQPAFPKADEPARGNEQPAFPPAQTISGESSMADGKPRWAAPVSNKPTYWVYKTTAKGVCKEVNLQARGDNGIYAEIVPGLVTQCFGAEAPFTVVTTRDASRAYWDIFIEQYDGPEEVSVTRNFNWAIAPTVKKPDAPPTGGPSDPNAPPTGGPSDPNAPPTGGPSDPNAPPPRGPSDPYAPPTGGPSGPDAPPTGGPSDPDAPPTLGPSDPYAPPTREPSDPDAPPTLGPSDPDAPPTPKPFEPNSPDGLSHPEDNTENWWFHDTRVGESSQKWVRITNTGTSPMKTTTAGMATSGVFALISHDCPTLLYTGNSCVVLLEFNPTEVSVSREQAYQAPFIIKTEAGTRTFNLNGVGLKKRSESFSVTPSSLTFAPAYDSRSYSKTVVIRNEGTEPLYLDKAPELKADSTALAVSNTTCTGQAMRTYETCLITVRLDATDVGQITGDLVISLFGKEPSSVPVTANVQPALGLTPLPLGVAFTDTQYRSVAITRFISSKINKPVNQFDLHIEVEGLPAGLSFNPQNNTITGIIHSSEANKSFNVAITVSYDQGTKSVVGYANLLTKTATPVTWHSRIGGPEITERLIGDTDILAATSFKEKIYLKSDAMGQGGRLEGTLVVKNKYGTVGSLSFTFEGQSRDACGSKWLSNGNYEICTNQAKDGTNHLAIELTRSFPKNAAPPTGDLDLELDFIPSVYSAVKAPAAPFIHRIKSRSDQVVVITEGLNIGSPAATDLDLGMHAVTDTRASLYKKIYLRKGSNFGRLGGTWKLEGSPEIQILSAGSVTPNSVDTTNTPSSRCAVEERGLYEYSCVATGEASSIFHSELFILLGMSPTKAFVGGVEHLKSTLTFTPHAMYPAAAKKPLVVQVQGSLIYDNRAILTSTNSKGVNSPVVEMDFGTFPHASGLTQDKDFYMLSESVHGHLGGTWTIEGDSNFSIRRVGSVQRGDGSSAIWNCKGATTGGTTKSQYCLADIDQSYVKQANNLMVRVRYSPKSGQTKPLVENRAVLRFTPSPKYPHTDNKTYEVALVGKAVAGDRIILTESNLRNVNAATDKYDFSEVPADNKVTKTFFVRSIDLNERLSGTFVLEGSPEFTLTRLTSVHRTNNNSTASCTNPTLSSYTATCGAADEHPAKGSYSDLKVEVTFSPKANGSAGKSNYQAQLEFIPNGANLKPAAPLSINLTGQSLFDQTVALTLNANAEVLSYSDTLLLRASAGKSVAGYVYLRGTTDNGKLRGRWVITGDSVFRINQFYTVRARSGSTRANLCAGDSIDSDKRGGRCSPAADPGIGEASDIQVTILAEIPAGVASGTEYKGTLTFVPNKTHEYVWLTPQSIELRAVSR